MVLVDLVVLADLHPLCHPRMLGLVLDPGVDLALDLGVNLVVDSFHAPGKGHISDKDMQALCWQQSMLATNSVSAIAIPHPVRPKTRDNADFRESTMRVGAVWCPARLEELGEYRP